MPRDVATGERTAVHRSVLVHERLPAPAPGRTVLKVPASYVARKQWEAMQRAGVARAEPQDVRGRPADRPVTGQHMVMARDEREAKYGKPLLFLDFQPGRAPLVIASGGTEHWQDMRDIADEHRHYGRDRNIGPTAWGRPPVPYGDIWATLIERRRRAQAGRITYGAETKGRL